MKSQKINFLAVIFVLAVGLAHAYSLFINYSANDSFVFNIESNREAISNFLTVFLLIISVVYVVTLLKKTRSRVIFHLFFLVLFMIHAIIAFQFITSIPVSVFSQQTDNLIASTAVQGILFYFPIPVLTLVVWLTSGIIAKTQRITGQIG